MSLLDVNNLYNTYLSIDPVIYWPEIFISFEFLYICLFGMLTYT